MTLKEAENFIYGTSWKGSVLGLSRINELLKHLGEPHKKLKFIHIAGTNGKGSTAAMLAEILKEAGYKTGLYTSPYIHFFNEMITINGKKISSKDIVTHISKIAEIKMPDAPTEYEIITALAFLHFYTEKCDIVVLEVGMGGRLDSTNVIETPEVAVITAIGLDHMTQLGNTIEKIAQEKAGIIKKGGAVVCHPQTASVEKVIREKCEQENAYVIFADNVKKKNNSLEEQVFSYKEREKLKITLLGDYQLNNAAVATETIDVLRSKGWEISETALYSGLRKTKWAFRFEIKQKKPLLITDVAHNPQGIQTTINTLSKICKEAVFIFGVLADKDYETMLEILIPFAKKFYLVTPKSPRAMPALKLMSYLRKKTESKKEVVVFINLKQAVEAAKKTAADTDVICVLGSFALVRDFV